VEKGSRLMGGKNVPKTAGDNRPFRSFRFNDESAGRGKAGKTVKRGRLWGDRQWLTSSKNTCCKKENPGVGGAKL